MRVLSQKGYSSPTDMEIYVRMQEIRFELPYSPDFLRDLANAYSWVEAGESPEEGFLDAVIPGGVTEERETELLEYHSNIQQFISSLDWSVYTGNSPLEKASSVIAALSSMEGGVGGEEGTPLPIFSDQKGESIARELNEEVEGLKSSDASQIGEFMAEKPTTTKEMLLASLDSRQKDLISKVALIGSRGKVKAQRMSARVKVQQMTEYSQVANLANLSSMGMPTYSYKLATKQLPVRKRQQSSKQSIVVLLDISGSMNCEDKKQWVTSLLLDRAKAVLENKAQLFIVPFGRSADIDSVVKVSNKSQAKEFIKALGSQLPFKFNAGGTDIARALRETEQAITSKTFDHSDKWQIVIMNDGEDTVNPKIKCEYPTHGFILGENNKDLQTVITNSGGHFERFM